MQILAQMGWSQWFLAVVIIAVCCFLMIVILLQRGRGGGLSGAFGGAGGSSAFGAKTGDVFTWITVIVATIFLTLAVVGNYAFDLSPEARRAAAPTTATTSGEVPEPGSLPPGETGESMPPPAGEVVPEDSDPGDGDAEDQPTP